MGVKDLFFHGKTISRKFLKRNYRQDPTFKKIISDPKIRGILNEQDEQEELHRMILQKADGKKGLSPDGMREILDDLVHKRKGKHISTEEGRKVATEIFTDSSRRYKSVGSAFNKISRGATVPEKNLVESRNNSFGKSNKITPAYSTYHANTVSTSSIPEKSEKEKIYFSDAMQSVKRNRNK